MNSPNVGEEDQKEHDEKDFIDSHDKIDVSICELFTDPLVYFVLGPLTRLKCIRRLPCIKRLTLLEKCEWRFQQELDVNTILRRLRFSYNSLSRLKN